MRYLVIATILACSACSSSEDTPEASGQLPTTEVPSPEAEVTPDPARATIDAWVIGWSAAQTASVRETCEQDPGCDSSQYTPEARPETTFGWDGAQEIERIEDWAKGPRYRVRANDRTVLIYLDPDKVVGAYLITSDGGRRNICRDEDCTPA